jgi:hypothetical protein
MRKPGIVGGICFEPVQPRILEANFHLVYLITIS